MQSFWPFLAFFLLAAHLLAMQVASAAPIVCCLLPKGTENPRCDQAARRLAAISMVALLLGVAVGLLLGWLAVTLGSRDYMPVLTRFYNRAWWGGWELGFSLVVMLGYWMPWNFWIATRMRRFFHILLAIIAATNLLYHFPPLLTVMAEQLSAPIDPATMNPITSPEFRALIARPLVIVKALHFAFAALAVSGAWLMLISPPGKAGSVDPERRGALVALIAMAIQMLLGMWLVVQVPPDEQRALMGGDPVAAGLLLVSIVFSLGAMNQLGGVVMDTGEDLDSLRKRIRSAAIGVVVIATIMICVAGRMSGLAG